MTESNPSNRFAESTQMLTRRGGRSMMVTRNSTVADLLRRYATVLSLEGANKFKVKAYRRAAETIEGLADDVAERIERKEDLTALPGIGASISGVIGEIVRTGTLSHLEQKQARLPPILAELTSNPRLDPKVVARVYKKLGISTLRELRENLDSGRIRELLGQRVEFQVRRGLDERPRHLLWSVRNIAEAIETYLRSVPGTVDVSAVGSLRRKQETVGDLNFLVTGKSAAAIFNGFERFGAVQSSAAGGKHERTFALSSGVRVHLRWCPVSEWGLSLILTTGSPDHVADLVEHAGAKSLEFSAQGLIGNGIEISSEAKVYSGLGLEFIGPELRESRGEVLAAAENALPELVRHADLRGDLHMHTTESDGANSIAHMAQACRDRGYEYCAITDHSQSLKITNGLSEERLRQHIKNIDALNAKLTSFRILKSAEVDILADGSLDYSQAMLKELDFTICSIHSRFALSREQQTERILRAMDNRYFTILGHATGRLLLKREGYDLDIERIMAHAKANGCLFEINSSPDRLDLSAEHAKLAKDLGIKIAVNTDAHAIRELDYISAGIHQARRGWLTASDVVNTYPVQKMLKLFRR